MQSGHGSRGPTTEPGGSGGDRTSGRNQEGHGRWSRAGRRTREKAGPSPLDPGGAATALPCPAPRERGVSARISEWRDERPSGLRIELLRPLGETLEAILRFEGRNLRWSGDKRAFLEVLEAYEAMKDGG